MTINQTAPVLMYCVVIPNARTITSKIVDGKTVVFLKCCAAQSSQDDVRVWCIIQRGVLGKKQMCVMCGIRDNAADVVYLDAIRKVLDSKQVRCSRGIDIEPVTCCCMYWRCSDTRTVHSYGAVP